MNTIKNTVATRVKQLQKWMEEERLDAFIVPTIDPHNSEYTPDHWKAREWLTGFDGSAGTAVVLAENGGALWTDSRYFLQAEEQLNGTPFELMRDGMPGTPSVAEWLRKNLPQGGNIGCYGEIMTQELADDLVGELGEEYQCVVTENDPFRAIWTDRPALPDEPLEIMPDETAGCSAADKLHRIFEAEHKHCPEAKYFLLNDLTEIAWALNLRGNDVMYNPVFVSYLMVGQSRSVLYTDEKRLSAEVKQHLFNAGVAVKRYKGWKNTIEDATEGEIFAFSRAMNLRVINHCKSCNVPFRFVEWEIPTLRAVKNAAEQEGFRRAMERDGVAMVKFLRWLDENVASGTLTEVGVDEKLTALRAEQPGFRGLSFATIAGYGPHGAIVHYEATKESAATLRPEGLLLLDSGAQYDCGTTDITRTIALGPVTDEERRVYTLVLKGHIGLSRCHFPEGSTGIQLDLAARYAMWQAGYDFGHGTGHGVGHRLCVHEGPQQIRKNLRGCTMIPFQAGMTITDEPGIYVAGRFGVRIENTLLAIPAQTTDFGTFLTFEPLTLCPIDLRPVDLTMMDPAERQWLNDYHATVRQRLMPLLSDAADKQWLENQTKEI